MESDDQEHIVSEGATANYKVRTERVAQRDPESSTNSEDTSSEGKSQYEPSKKYRASGYHTKKKHLSESFENRKGKKRGRVAKYVPRKQMYNNESDSSEEVQTNSEDSFSTSAEELSKTSLLSKGKTRKKKKPKYCDDEVSERADKNRNKMHKYSLYQAPKKVKTDKWTPESDVWKDSSQSGLGKVGQEGCPEEIATAFCTESPSFEKQKHVQDNLSGKESEVIFCRANPEIPIIPGSGTLSHLENTPPPQPRINQALKRYKKYLQSCYKAKKLAQLDKYLPTQKVPYINLAMVIKGEIPEQRDEFTRQTLHGGIDQILKSKKRIVIEELLTPEDSKKPISFILVEGPPGIGKSTFAWEVCRRWDEIKILKDYHIVVLLKLREKWVLDATSLHKLFRYQSNPKLSKRISKALTNTHGQNLLLVLDGFDEIPHSLHEESVIKGILCKQLLPCCTIVITTRPSAALNLKKLCQPEIDKHVEIIGFTEEERESYITKVHVFKEKPALQANFLKYMFSIPHIKSMMYIPLNCAIVAQVYYEAQVNHQHPIPKTRTDLYKALTNSILVRHMNGKKYKSTSMLPEGLMDGDMESFKCLAKFAYDSYHKCETRKVTFFEEDIPEGLVNFGFMNESTEMYASKGVERIFSFLHLSLQEYLAAWHLADNYSIDFQVAYHRLALDGDMDTPIYKGNSEEEKALISSLEPLRKSLVEPAMFLAGITGWKCKSEEGRNHWDVYLCHDTAGQHHWLLLRSLYEAQNPTLIRHYFAAECRRKIGFCVGFTPYDCYVLSYCLAHSSDPFHLNIMAADNGDSLMETCLDDHCKYTTPRIKCLDLSLCLKNIVSKCLNWLMKAKFLTELEEMNLSSSEVISSDLVYTFLKLLINLQSLKMFIHSPASLEWLTALKFLSKLKVLHILSTNECSPPSTIINCWPTGLKEVTLNTHFPSRTLRSSANVFMKSVLGSALKLYQLTNIKLPNISRETMAGVHSILLHHPNLATFELERTRLGYYGILYICRALKKNTTLRRLVICDDLQLPPSRIKEKCSTITSFERVILPEKTTCTDFLLELNNILKGNTTLKEVKIQSGLFLPLPIMQLFNKGGEIEYLFNGTEHFQWTGLGPFEQFNVGAISGGICRSLKRSFSSSDLTKPETQLFWKKNLNQCVTPVTEVNFKSLFIIRGAEGKKSFSLPSFTAPDTVVLSSFSDLDPRLKDCLNIASLNLYVENLKESYEAVLEGVSEQTDKYNTLQRLMLRRRVFSESDLSSYENIYSDDSNSDEDFDSEDTDFFM